jgi:hypothetical protein
MKKSDISASAELKRIFGCAVAASLVGGAYFIAPAQATPAVPDALMDAWNKTIAKTPVPGEGCFTASYPGTSWTKVACVKAPDRPYIPSKGQHNGAFTTGDGNDFAAVTSTLTSEAVGSFPKVAGLKSETDDGTANSYSLQLNSNFISSDQACSGSANPQKCLGWEQFVYSSDERAGFMQYWLIYYDTKCPTGWQSDGGGDCYTNSSAVSIPQEVITQLKYLQLSGTAVANGIDTFMLTVQGGKAYSTTGQDSVVYLADGWNASEFNVVGDGGGSEAVFNAGTKLTVGIDLTDGSTTAPTCEAHDGTTGETNNLDLGKCKASGGATPSVTFKESLAK